MTMRVAVTVNGTEYSRDVEPRLLLIHFLRDELGLTGSHWGCDTSNCGSCVVWLDNTPVKACTVLAAMAGGRSVRTVEDLERDGRLDPVQQGFIECHGLQCGFCTPGMMMTARWLLDHHPVTPAAGARLCRVIDHLDGVLGDPGAPLVIATAAQHLAAAVLYTFPNTALSEPTTSDRHDAHPETVRRAVAFIETDPARQMTLTEIAADRRRLGARIGFLAVLHTWSQQLTHHPHLHCLVPAGGLAFDNSRWISCRPRFLLPVPVLRRMFRGKMLALLRQAYANQQLRFPGALAPLEAGSRAHRRALLWRSCRSASRRQTGPFVQMPRA